MKRFCPLVVALEFFPETPGRCPEDFSYVYVPFVFPESIVHLLRRSIFSAAGSFGQSDFSLLVTLLLVTFSWLFRGFFVALICLEKKTVFGRFSWLFCGFFVAFRGFFVALILGKFYAYSPWNSLLTLGNPGRPNPQNILRVNIEHPQNIWRRGISLIFLSLLFLISLLFCLSRNPCFFDRFSLLFQGFLGFGGNGKSLFFGGFPCVFSKKQGKEDQGFLLLEREELGP